MQDSPSESEKFGLAVDDLKKEILKTRLGKFMLWTIDRLSQVLEEKK